MLSKMARQMWMISSDHKSRTSTTDDNVCPSQPRWEKNYAYIAWALDISQGNANSVVQNQLDYWKVGRWAPKNLTDNHKAHCMGPLHVCCGVHTVNNSVISYFLSWILFCCTILPEKNRLKISKQIIRYRHLQRIYR